MAALKPTIHGKRRPRRPGPMERKFLQALGTTIKQRRTAKKLTADAMAKRVGLTISAQFRREAGSTSFFVEDVVRYAAVLGCQPRELIPDIARQSPKATKG